MRSRIAISILCVAGCTSGSDPRVCPLAEGQITKLTAPSDEPPDYSVVRVDLGNMRYVMLKPGTPARVRLDDATRLDDPHRLVEVDLGGGVVGIVERSDLRPL